MSGILAKKKKPFGLGASRNKQIKEDVLAEKGDDKWLEGISSQFNGNSDDDDLDVRAVSMQLLLLDPTNPRELDIHPDEITSNMDVLKLPESALVDGCEGWIDAYKEKVIALFGETKKAQDCLNVAMFAADLKSPKNLINPITVWRDETSFYIFAGERRYLAHLLLEAGQIYTRIWNSKPNRFDMKILQWQENNLREGLSLHEKLVNIRQILEEWSKEFPDQKMTVRKFTHLISMKRSQAGNYLRVARSDIDALNDAIKFGSISTIELAYELVGLNISQIESYIARISAGEVISKEMIKDEISGPDNTEKSLKPTKNKLKAKRPLALKLNKKANQKSVAFIVNTLVDKINSETLSDSINALDLKESKGLSQALNSIIEFIEVEGMAE